MSTEQRRALAGTIPTTEVIRDAVTFPRDRLGEPLDISGDRFDAWLARIRRAAKAEALREAAKAHETEGLDVNTESMPHHDGWSYVTVSQWLRARAAEYETGDQR